MVGSTTFGRLTEGKKTYWQAEEKGRKPCSLEAGRGRGSKRETEPVTSSVQELVQGISEVRDMLLLHATA